MILYPHMLNGTIELPRAVPFALINDQVKDWVAEQFNGNAAYQISIYEREDPTRRTHSYSITCMVASLEGVFPTPRMMVVHQDMMPWEIITELPTVTTTPLYTTVAAFPFVPIAQTVEQAAREAALRDERRAVEARAAALQQGTAARTARIERLRNEMLERARLRNP